MDEEEIARSKKNAVMTVAVSSTSPSETDSVTSTANKAATSSIAATTALFQFGSIPLTSEIPSQSTEPVAPTAASTSFGLTGPTSATAAPSSQPASSKSQSEKTRQTKGTDDSSIRVSTAEASASVPTSSMTIHSVTSGLSPSTSSTTATGTTTSVPTFSFGAAALQASNSPAPLHTTSTLRIWSHISKFSTALNNRFEVNHVKRFERIQVVQCNIQHGPQRSSDSPNQGRKSKRAFDVPIWLGHSAKQRPFSTWNILVSNYSYVFTTAGFDAAIDNFVCRDNALASCLQLWLQTFDRRRIGRKLTICICLIPDSHRAVHCNHIYSLCRF
jgi:hypothetical protein